MDQCKVLDARLNKMKDQYKSIINNNSRDKKKVSIKKVSKEIFVQKIEYVYITFRNKDTSDIILDKFKKNASFLDKCCGKGKIA